MSYAGIGLDWVGLGWMRWVGRHEGVNYWCWGAGWSWAVQGVFVSRVEWAWGLGLGGVDRNK